MNPSVKKKILELDSMKDPVDVYWAFLELDTATKMEIWKHLGQFDSFKTAVSKAVKEKRWHLRIVK
jgi:hypothetical protein